MAKYIQVQFSDSDIEKINKKKGSRSYYGYVKELVLRDLQGTEYKVHSIEEVKKEFGNIGFSKKKQIGK